MQVAGKGFALSSENENGRHLKWYTTDNYVKSNVEKGYFDTFRKVRDFIVDEREELVERGVLIPASGSRSHLIREDFDHVALSIMQERAKRAQAVLANAE